MDPRDTLALALGKVTLSFQSLEAALAILAGQLLSTDSRTAQAVTTALSFRRLCDLVASLAPLRLDTPRLDALRALLAEARRAEEERNLAIHSI